MDGAASPMPSVSQLRDRIDDELSAGWDLYIATRSSRVVGMLAIEPRDAVLDQIFVLPREQRSGVGTRLLNAAKREMPQGFTLRIASANRRAARFYERSGLSHTGVGSHPVTGAPVQYLVWDGR